MGWIKCTKTEDYIRSHGVEFQYHSSLKISEFDPGWDKENKGRTGDPIDPEVVLALWQALDEGRNLAPLIVIRAPQGFYILDGKRRFAAAIAKELTTVAAYVVGVDLRSREDSVVIDKIQLGANAILNGDKPSTAFRVAQAIRLMEVHGCSLKEAGAEMGVTVDAIEKQRAKIASIEKLDRQDVDYAGANGILSDLAPLHPLKDEIFASVFRTGMKMPASERKEFIERCVGKPNGEIIALVKQCSEREELRTEGSKRKPVRQFIAMLKSAREYCRKNRDRIEVKNSADAKELEQLGKWISGRCIELACAAR